MTARTPEPVESPSIVEMEIRYLRARLFGVVSACKSENGSSELAKKEEGRSLVESLARSVKVRHTALADAISVATLLRPSSFEHVKYGMADMQGD